MATEIRYRVISIGTLANHPLWSERIPVRTGHATTTLVTSGDAHVLIDPSLPAPALAARLEERSGLKPEAVTHVFLTSVDRLHRRALAVFDDATWLAHEPELDATQQRITAELEQLDSEVDQEIIDALEDDLLQLRRIRPAEDSIAAGVDLFPLPGVTAGTCGILLPLPRSTVCICGDAVATVEHLEQASILPGCHDVEQAQESLREVIQIADLIIPGRDNLTTNPLRVPGGF